MLLLLGPKLSFIGKLEVALLFRLVLFMLSLKLLLLPIKLEEPTAW